MLKATIVQATPAPQHSRTRRLAVPLLLASQGRPLRVATGARATLEIFGHGIDLARGVTLENAPAGVTATFQGGTGGAANAGRRCGAIGSVKLLLDAPGYADLPLEPHLLPMRRNRLAEVKRWDTALQYGGDSLSSATLRFSRTAGPGGD